MQLPFFYGWVIVVIAMIAGFFSSGVCNVTMAMVPVAAINLISARWPMTKSCQLTLAVLNCPV